MTDLPATDPVLTGFAAGPVPHRVRHRLATHPALTVDSVAELAARRPRAGVEQHRADLPLLHPSGARTRVTDDPADVVRGLAHNGGWTTLGQVGDDPAVAGIQAELSASVGRVVPGAVLTSSVIASAPHGVTPAHLDVRHVLLLQVRGTKRFWTGSFVRRGEQEAETRRRFTPVQLNLHRMPDRAQEHVLEPGDGLWVPAFTPHWAVVDDQVSVALSVAVDTPGLVRLRAAWAADAVLRRHGLALPAPGRSRLLDRSRVDAVRAVRTVRTVRAGRTVGAVRR